MANEEMSREEYEKIKKEALDLGAEKKLLPGFDKSDEIDIIVANVGFRRDQGEL
jgi:hypothetical protein